MIKINVTDVLVNVKVILGNVKGKKFKFEVAKILTSKNQMLKLKFKILTSSGQMSMVGVPILQMLHTAIYETSATNFVIAVSLEENDFAQTKNRKNHTE